MPARGFEPVPRPAENRVDILPKTRKNKSVEHVCEKKNSMKKYVNMIVITFLSL